MPRNQGTSRKGKPGKNERAVGLGKALQRAQTKRYRPRSDGKARRGEGGMAMQTGVESIGLQPVVQDKTRSVLELQDLDEFLLQAEMASREFASEKQGLVVLDETGYAYKPNAVSFDDEKRPEFVFSELSVPRRPAWDEDTTPQELDQAERKVFVEWRRAIALKEEELMKLQSSSTVTPFEKNLEVWRQLWRVLERSSCLVQLVDARNPLFYLSADLRDYAADLGKPMMVLVNKSDYLSRKQRQVWNDYLSEQGWEVVFFSAVREQDKLDLAAQLKRREEQEAEDPRLVLEDSNSQDDEDGDESVGETSKDPVASSNVSEEEASTDGRGVDTPLTRQELMETMLAFAHKHDCQPDPRYDDRIQFGMVGFPNVGKSSVINVLVGSSKHSHGVVRVGVASQPGKTKHFQTLFLPDSDELMLCDCPGLVFPSFVSNTADLIAAGVYPIAQMRDHWPVVNLICQRIPREIINAQYGIQLPTPTPLELRERGLEHVPPPTAEEFLSTFCVARSLLAASSGVPDYPRAARMVIKDYADGKLLYCHAPPNLENPMAFQRETIATALDNTEKLREKLLRQQQQLSTGQADSANEAHSTTNYESAEDVDNFLDGDLLNLVGGDSAPSKANTNNNSKTKARKWGKKNRKNRNNDPYGCHSDPDDLAMLQEHKEASAGVVVKGKYGRKGYTRPTTYGVASNDKQTRR